MAGELSESPGKQTVRAAPFAPGVVRLTSYEDISFALRSPDFRVPLDRFPGDISGDILVALHGDEHLARRRLEYPLFSSKSLVEYDQELLKPIVQSFRDRCNSVASQGQHLEFDLVHFGLTTIARIGAAITGIDGADSEADAADLVRLVKRMAAGQNISWLVDKAAAERVMDDARVAQREFIDRFYRASARQRQAEVGQWRRGQLTSDRLRRDLLSVMFADWHDDWDPDLPVRETFNYLNASIGTSTRVLCNCFDEIADWALEHPDRAADLADPGFIRGAIEETLRLHVVLPAIIREVTADTLLPSGVGVRSGATVALMFAEANRSERIFGEDSEKFDPDRPSRIPLGRAYGLAFGGGPHMCMGRRLAIGGPAPDPELRTNGTVPTLLQILMQV